MSRNANIRKMAAKLPPFPKLKDGRKIQRDSRGQIIYCDHFRELKEIQSRHMAEGKSSRDPIILAEWANYSKMVMAYDRSLKGKKISAFKVVAATLIVVAAANAVFYLITGQTILQYATKIH